MYQLEPLMELPKLLPNMLVPDWYLGRILPVVDRLQTDVSMELPLMGSDPGRVDAFCEKELGVFDTGPFCKVLRVLC